MVRGIIAINIDKDDELIVAQLCGWAASLPGYMMVRLSALLSRTYSRWGVSPEVIVGLLLFRGDYLIGETRLHAFE